MAESSAPRGRNLRWRIGVLAGLLVAFNAAAWIWAATAFAGYSVLIGTATLAYTLGLRHAVDAADS